MIIVGAGMAGLLAANMLAHSKPLVYEKQKELPNNHHAVLRFRSPLVGDVLGIPFQKVQLIKDSVPWRNRVSDALSYSMKCTGIARSDRSIAAGPVAADRWIAPPNLIQQMADRSSISFGTSLLGAYETDDHVPRPLISTIPMPVLMDLLDYPEEKRPEFHTKEAWVVKCHCPDFDAYVSLLVPDPHSAITRISITGSEMTIELMPDKIVYSVDNIVSEARSYFGFGFLTTEPVSHHQKYAKIAPVDDDLRKAFMHWATDKFNIYSLGRFATWRPGLLLDDLVQDIRLIDGWIRKNNRYAVARHR